MYKETIMLGPRQRMYIRIPTDADSMQEFITDSNVFKRKEE